MSLNNVWNWITDAVAAIPALIASALTTLAPVKQMILDQFGWPGLMATYIAVGVILLLVLWRIVKLTFATVKYLVVPALALAFVVSMVSPYSFAAALPVTVTVCSLILLAKG